MRVNNMATGKDGMRPDGFDDPGMAHVGGFEALEHEHDYRVSTDEIEGEIPEAVRGTFYHIGPGRNRIGGQTFGHWFDGDGMVHAITLDNAGAHYRNRFVRTPKYRAETRAGRIVKRSFGHNAPGGILANMGRLPANCANTSLAWHAGRLLALWEGGRPWEIDPFTLATRREYDFGGRLGRFDAFSAHGKVDPVTGCYFNHGMSMSARGPRLNLYRVNPEGELDRRGGFRLPFNGFIHDFALAGDCLVYFLHPVGFRNPLPFLAGWKSINECMDYHPEWGMEAVVVDKATLEPVRRFKLDPFVVFHFGNAWREGDRIVVQLMRYEDFAVNAVLSNIFEQSSAGSGAGRLYRYELDLAGGGVSAEPLPLAREGEFPQWDGRFSSRPTRHLYASALVPNDTAGFFNAVQYLDSTTGRTLLHEPGPGRFVSESVLIPTGESEACGFLGSLVYDARVHRSELRILAADTLAPRARVPLRHHVPFGFHSTWLNERALADEA